MKSPTLQPYQYRERREQYSELFGATFQRLFEDNNVSDGALRDEAYEYLKVLERPDMAPDNSPLWIKWYAERQPEKSFDVTSRSIFEGLYRTADDFEMPSSARFISACICAEALVIRDAVDPELEAEAIAGGLADLAANWIGELMNPCE